MGLRLDGVGVDYDGVPAVRGVDLVVPTGTVLAVVGPSGSGKSSLLRAAAGLEPLATGRVWWDGPSGGQDLTRVPTHKRGFAVMFQDGQLFDHLSVAANVGYALRLRRDPGRRERVAELLDLVGLASYGDRAPRTLSGGERQRVALARSLAADPRLLLLDEPLSSLDAALRDRLATDLARILRAAGTTALLVTHDQEEAFAVADRLAVVRDGALVQEGTTTEVWSRPADAATALFLGYARVLEGAPAAAVLRAGRCPTAPAVALRRSALVADATSPTTAPEPGPDLVGTVTAARATPDQVRLVVEVDGVGPVDAVGSGSAVPAPGERVRLRVDAARLAPLPATGPTTGPPDEAAGGPGVA